MKPSGVSHSSCSAIISSVCAIDFSRSASMPASAVIRTPSSTAASTRIGGVPAMKRPIPAAGAYGRCIANWSSWPNQPWIGVPSARRGP